MQYCQPPEILGVNFLAFVSARAYPPSASKNRHRLRLASNSHTEATTQKDISYTAGRLSFPLPPCNPTYELVRARSTTLRLDDFLYICLHVLYTSSNHNWKPASPNTPPADRISMQCLDLRASVNRPAMSAHYRS